jgi:very-short-patch-repair endonuclease
MPIPFGSNSFSTELERIVEAQLKQQGLTRAEVNDTGAQQDNIYYVEWVTQTGIPVDFYVPSKNLIIQVDGPSHFLIDSEGVLSKTYRLSDVRIDELFRAYGYDVLRIHYQQVMPNRN